MLWATSEFGFVRLPESAATGSSMMPQKLNPDVAELVRGKAGTAIGRLAGLLATVKGLPLAYDRDLQEDKSPVFATRHETRLALEALTVLVSGLEVDRERMAEAASDPLLLATDAAEALVRDGVPFRDAHEQVAASVRDGSFEAPAERRDRDRHPAPEAFATRSTRRATASSTTSRRASPTRGVVHAALEVRDQHFARAHEPTLRHGSGLEPALHRLDERDVLLGDLVVPGHEFFDLLGRGVDPEVVVGHLDRPAQPVRHVALERDVRDAGRDVDRRRREEEVVLGLRHRRLAASTASSRCRPAPMRARARSGSRRSGAPGAGTRRG